MSVMDLLVQLRDAGITVPAASALVDEDRVVATLGLTNRSAPAAAFDFGSTKQAVAAPPPPPEVAPANGNGTANGGALADAPPPAPQTSTAPPVDAPPRARVPGRSARRSSAPTTTSRAPQRPSR